jgi:hypothetical protein
LEARIAALELGETYKATQSDIQKVQANCLQQLRDVKTALENDGGNAAVSTNSAQIEAITAERDALQRKVAKLEYRVQHILESMEYLYEKAKKTSTALDN